MDLNPVTPLPPGMVPSESREDMREFMEQQSDKDSTNVIKEGTIESSGANVVGVPSPETVGIPVLSGSPPKAWMSPSDEADEKGGEGISESFSNNSSNSNKPSHKLTSATNGREQTPHKSTSQDLRKELFMSGNKVPHSQPQQSTPKRTLTPLKRSNKVAPSPSTAVTKPTSGEDGSLQSSSASMLEPKSLLGSYTESGRPGSAPTAKDGGKKAGKKEDGDIQPQQVSLVPTVIVKTKDETDGATPAKPVEALYSSVVKKKSTKTQQNGYKEPEVLAAMPKLETYEPQQALDTSTVYSNPDVGSSESDLSSTNQNASNISHDDHMLPPDPLYEAVDAPDVPPYSAALYKGLKRHDDAQNNVQLVSIKGNAQPENKATTFPSGSSSDMLPLHYAAATGNKKALAELLSSLPITQDPVERVLGTEKMCKREGVDVFDSEGRTPLMHAVHNDQKQCVKLLAEAGANINIESNDGSSCLHQVAYTGSLEMMALLLSLGADGLKRDNEGRVPLHWCTNNTEPKCIELLLDKVPGLNVNIRDGAMMTPLMWAAFHGRPEHVRLLKEKGADSALRDIDGMAAVHWSVQRHDTRALQVLIDSESAQYYDNKGKTVMHQAAEQGCAKAVSLIKAVKPTSVNDLDENGRTPLHWATVCENPEVIRTLLPHGADPNVRDNSNHTALEYATEKGLHYCALLLTKEEALEENDGYHSILMYGSTSATVGARALQQQEGQLLDSDEIKKALNHDQILQIQTVCRGSWINKFTNNGKGPLHPRFFWVNPSNIKICWAKTKDASNRDTKAEVLVGVRSSASPAVFGRKDFDPMNKHKYAFTIFTNQRVLDVVGLSSEDYKMWLNGLQLLLHLGSINATRLLSIIQNSSGGELRPIP